MNPDSDRYDAFWDFSTRIITPTIQRLISDPASSHVVELGFGDGRLLRPAASFFSRVTGIAMDGSDNQAEAKARLGGSGSERISFEQLSEDGGLPLASASVDFIYSLYGVVRLPDLKAFDALMTEIARALRPGGVTILWFGRMSRLPFALPGKDWWRGWAQRPLPGTHDQNALHLRMYHAWRVTLGAGMRGVSLSTPLHPDTSWRLFRGGPMSYITAWKPES